jgi:hypothetical protein
LRQCGDQQQDDAKAARHLNSSRSLLRKVTPWRLSGEGRQGCAQGVRDLSFAPTNGVSRRLGEVREVPIPDSCSAASRG